MFERGWTIFRVRGIPIRLDVTLLLLLPYLVFVTSLEFSRFAEAMGYAPEMLKLPALAWGFILAILVFVSILLHELGHSLVALKAGARVRSITLMLLGGVSLIEDDIPPERESWMAFVGPLVSMGLAVGAYLLFRFVPFFPPDVRVGLVVLATINGLVAIFNLLPAFPMDGGRVLRGLLSKRLGFARATRIATAVGRVMAILFGIWGLLTLNFILILIAAFIYAGAVGEQVRAESREALSGLSVSNVMTDRVGEAHVDELAGEVARRLLADEQVAVRVLDGRDAEHPNGKTVGVMMMWDLVRLETERGFEAPVLSGLSQAPIIEVHASEDAAGLIDKLAPLGRANAAIVLNENEVPVGIVTAEELQRIVSTRSNGGPQRPDGRRRGPAWRGREPSPRRGAGRPRIGEREPQNETAREENPHEPPT